MKPMLVSSGEPAGIGPDICLALATSQLPIVVMGNKSLLMARAKQLKLDIVFHDYQEGAIPVALNQLTVLSIPCDATPIAGVLNSLNASYVLKMLTTGITRCISGEFSALITAPVHKGLLNEGGFLFTGHTEFLAEGCHVPNVVMMLACKAMRVALVTTHIPLKDVPQAITMDLLQKTIHIIHTSLQNDFGIKKPKLFVAGLNPHAGEGGHLGREEIDVIIPAITALQQQGIDVQGPYSADTMFTLTEPCDAFIAMYHDQGLAVLKYAGFGEAVNVTLGLPIIRTSVDHGTALSLAGKGAAKSTSLLAAADLAYNMVLQRMSHHDHH